MIMAEHELNYDPLSLPREFKTHYISASDQDITDMLETLGLQNLEDLYAHLPRTIRMLEAPQVPSRLEYRELFDHVVSVSRKNKDCISFAGDGLTHISEHPVAAKIAGIRGLTTAYTPYQPERSQGTLMTMWLYQNALSRLTGMEAINASMYERSTCLYEAIQCATRIVRNSSVALIADHLYPGDKEVLLTLAEETELELRFVPVSDQGIIDLEALKHMLNEAGKALACVVFQQVNCLGNIEPVHNITDLAHEFGAQVIAIIDPLHLAQGGLIPPSEFGQNGADMIVGEAQHLAIDANFGGPGLGLFGIRHNEQNKNSIRSTAGRYVGAALDEIGRECKVMVLSTREQHIRKEKATSNICSNQGFVATMAGACMLSRGDQEFGQILEHSVKLAYKAAQQLSAFEGVALSYPDQTFLNSICLDLPVEADQFLEQAQAEGIIAGVNLKDRVRAHNKIMISFSDRHSDQDLQKLVEFFRAQFKPSISQQPKPIPQEFIRKSAPGIPKFDHEKIIEYYKLLGEQNISPDNGPYPLGSCTMKYNPYINDACASLTGFTKMHPQSPEEFSQGCLQILYEVQEIFKTMLGLQGCTTQPVAGAQGELVGIKMFQAFHRDHSTTKRDILIIPRSAHGTNYATATMAGFKIKNSDGVSGLQLIDSDSSGQIDMEQLRQVVENHGPRIAGIMITNPNTSGIMETRFAEIADMIHEVGGLVYMDGANLNAIAGWVNLGAMGVDAVHSNLHKTFSIPHGGGGPGDAIVAVSDKLVNYLPGSQYEFKNGHYSSFRTSKSIGSFHRHHGNFAHKVRAYTYLRALGPEGIRRMCAVAVLSARYLHHQLKHNFPGLPASSTEPKMHEFILTLAPETFEIIEKIGIKHSLVIARVGKLFLDFGMHAPTVAWPETYGLMVEPTESYTKAELDRFIEVVSEIQSIINENPEVLLTVPHFTPVDRIDDVNANKNLIFTGPIEELPVVLPNRIPPSELARLSVKEIRSRIIEAHQCEVKQ